MEGKSDNLGLFIKGILAGRAEARNPASLPLSSAARSTLILFNAPSPTMELPNLITFSEAFACRLTNFEGEVGAVLWYGNESESGG